MKRSKPIPIIDLFAGPGGLGEGFSSVLGDDGQPFFRIGLSIEKDPIAHKTLTLRAVFRALRKTPAVNHYYSYARGELDELSFRSIPEVAAAFSSAADEARCMELGKDDPSAVDDAIRHALRGEADWLLIGGPPCQAYSVAGRARRTKDATFEHDAKHFLYREYLRIIRKHRPAIFVMENVKGLLTSKHAGGYMFHRILADLAKPGNGLEYEIRSFVKHSESGELDGQDYVIEAERYGIPQARHRVILLGIRRDFELGRHSVLQPVAEPFTVKQAIGDLPRLRSRLSVSRENLDDWRAAVLAAPDQMGAWDDPRALGLLSRMRKAASAASDRRRPFGGRFIPHKTPGPDTGLSIKSWYATAALEGALQHESRAHMAADLARYLFAASFAELEKRSPKLDEFPPSLLPKHKNTAALSEGGRAPFMDRFRVQVAGEPCTTVVSHIAKDGHYYIHFDPTQCRSLTVREAARLQTFPDTYFFEGNRTQQYTQVGNAVPPLLANKLARIVARLFKAMQHSRS